MVVILIGYMASGKSTLGRILAKKLNYEFLDLDDFIEKKENAAVSDIFNLKGEIHFRALETQYLKELLASKNNLVLSLGGGTPCYSNNMETILNADNTKSIYLKASIPTLITRLKNEKSTRPLIAHIETDDLLAEFIGKHLFERSQFYSLANATITTDNKIANDIVEELVLQLF
ncbi:shikimate kinase [Mariniflexile fucanivorans]|uniref:Shikimate kinase n=1 Tax=Mariniflexile fucanivorans TaxID=264023 RepID=A0A4R1R8X6_9FLAO|nr:shikimate kinase [Mariniflexile fucanivorans]TCL62133.1 shikimate kinase [Mariniflexile fucanivorans]